MSDYYEPKDSNVGMLERRMLYLVHQMTFRDYFARREYAKILAEHIERVNNAPAAIEFPEGAQETSIRLQVLIAALKAAGWQDDSLRELFKRQMEPKDVVWVATERVEAAGIFVPYYHARDKGSVEDLFDDGFLRDDEGWGNYEVHKLFSSKTAGYGNPEHKRRMRTVENAKKYNVIRPITVRAAADGTVVLGSKGNQYCCRSGACQWNGDADSYCSAAEGGGCSLISDECTR